MNIKIARRVNKKLYYGWVIVTLSALSIFFSAPGQTYSISAFINSYINEFGYSRTLISSAYSFATLLSGLLLIIMGKLVDKYGQRKMMVFCGIMLGITCIFNSFVSNLSMIFIGFFASRYFGQGSLSLVPSTLVPQWFEKRRAFAISVYRFGGTIAAMVVPIFNVWVINHYGWNMAWRGWGILLFILFVPLMGLLVVNKPEDIDVMPDNVINNLDSKNDMEERLERESWHLKDAAKTKEFWFLGFCVSITPMIVTGLVFHFYSIMGEKGIDRASASYVLGLMAVPGFLFPFIAGFILDRYKPKIILALTLLLQTVAMVLLIFVSNSQGAIIFIIILGVAMSVQGVASGVMWPNYFGRKYLGSIQAVATMFIVIGSSLGPLPFGLVFDKLGNYNYAIIVMSIVSLLGTLLAIFCNKPKRLS